MGVPLTRKVEGFNVKKKSISQLLSEMGRTGYQGRKLAEAVDLWEKTLEVNPDYIDACFNLAVLYRNSPDKEKALYYREKLKEKSPEAYAKFEKNIKQ